MIFKILFRIFDFKLQKAFRRGYLLACKICLEQAEKSKDLKDLTEKIALLRDYRIKESVSDDVYIHDLFEDNPKVNKRR